MKLEALRKAKGLNQDELAKLSGVSQAHISRLERGLKNATWPILKNLAGALGVTVPELMGEQPATEKAG